MLSRWRYGLRVRWYRASRVPLHVGLVVAVVAAFFGAGAYLVESHIHHEKELTCLALNVYFEARGEPTAGQYAVAEVTLNRVASPRYPQTICRVVFEHSWDPLRRRYVGEFSWTELPHRGPLDPAAWAQAWKVADTVYHHPHMEPALSEALNYHAVYIEPRWARRMKVIARIANHVFYR